MKILSKELYGTFDLEIDDNVDELDMESIALEQKAILFIRYMQLINANLKKLKLRS